MGLSYDHQTQLLNYYNPLHGVFILGQEKAENNRSFECKWNHFILAVIKRNLIKSIIEIIKVKEVCNIDCASFLIALFSGKFD